MGSVFEPNAKSALTCTHAARTKGLCCSGALAARSPRHRDASTCTDSVGTDLAMLRWKCKVISKHQRTRKCSRLVQVPDEDISHADPKGCVGGGMYSGKRQCLDAQTGYGLHRLRRREEHFGLQWEVQLGAPSTRGRHAWIQAQAWPLAKLRVCCGLGFRVLHDVPVQ